MKDCCLDTLFSLGQACVDGEETLTRPCIYIKTVFPICQPPKQKKKTPVRGSVRKLVALVHHRDRHHHQHFHHSTGLQR